jgi:hypothetical protein
MKEGGGCSLFSLCMLTFILFLGLKLGQVGVVAEWSYLWVTAPLWGYCAFISIVVVVVFGSLVIASRVNERK